MFGFNRQKPRQFNYVPRFFNPEEEERDKKKAAKGVYSEADDEKYVPGSLIKRGRVKRMVITEEEKNLNKRTMMVRAVIFLVLLLVAAYFLMTFTGFEVMVEAFTQGGGSY